MRLFYLTNYTITKEEKEKSGKSYSLISVLRKFFRDILAAMRCGTGTPAAASEIEDVVTAHLEAIRRVLRPTFEAASRDPNASTEDLVNALPASSLTLSLRQRPLVLLLVRVQLSLIKMARG